METRFADPEVRRLAASMTIVEEESFNAAFPAQRFSDVTLALKDGRILRSGPTEAPGDPEAPVTMAEVRAKFHRYAATGVGTARATEIETLVGRLGDGSGTAALFHAVTRPIPEPAKGQST